MFVMESIKTSLNLLISDHKDVSQTLIRVTIKTSHSVLIRVSIWTLPSQL